MSKERRIGACCTERRDNCSFSLSSTDRDIPRDIGWVSHRRGVAKRGPTVLELHAALAPVIIAVVI